MMSRYKVVLSTMVLCFSGALWAQQSGQTLGQTDKSTLPSGTEIKVRTDQQISADAKTAGQQFPGTITEAVSDTQGHVLIPKGARAELSTVAGGRSLTEMLYDANRDGLAWDLKQPNADRAAAQQRFDRVERSLELHHPIAYPLVSAKKAILRGLGRS